jgi:hypothetical protein
MGSRSEQLNAAQYTQLEKEAQQHEAGDEEVEDRESDEEEDCGEYDAT